MSFSVIVYRPWTFLLGLAYISEPDRRGLEIHLGLFALSFMKEE